MEVGLLSRPVLKQNKVWIQGPYPLSSCSVKKGRKADTPARAHQRQAQPVFLKIRPSFRVAILLLLLFFEEQKTK